MHEKNKKVNNEKGYKLPKSFHVEMYRTGKNISVSVYGVISIMDIDDFKCVFKVRQGKLVVRGKMLNLSVFENSILEVTGCVEGVDLK